MCNFAETLSEVGFLHPLISVEHLCRRKRKHRKRDRVNNRSTLDVNLQVIGRETLPAIENNVLKLGYGTSLDCDHSPSIAFISVQLLFVVTQVASGAHHSSHSSAFFLLFSFSRFLSSLFPASA